MTLVKLNNRPSLVDELLNDFPAVFKNELMGWKNSVPVNVKETKDAYLLDVVAPGLQKNDFKINLDKNILTISAEKKNEVKQENEKQVRREYSYQSFKRSFTLDEKIDEERIEATYVNGVLSLNLPKKTDVKGASKEISIK